MPAVIEIGELAAARRRAGEFQRRLDRFGAGVAEEHGVEMRRTTFDQRLGQQTRQERAIHLHHVRQIQIEHVADHLRDLRMIAADRVHAEPAQHVEVAVAFLVPEILALGFRVHPVEPDGAKHLHQRRVDVLLVQLVVLPEPFGDDLLDIKSDIAWSVYSAPNCRASAEPSAPKCKILPRFDVKFGFICTQKSCFSCFFQPFISCFCVLFCKTNPTPFFHNQFILQMVT